MSLNELGDKELGFQGSRGAGLGTQRWSEAAPCHGAGSRG